MVLDDQLQPNAKAPGFVEVSCLEEEAATFCDDSSLLPDIPPLSPLVKAVIGSAVCLISVIGSYKTKMLYLIGSGSAFGSVFK